MKNNQSTYRSDSSGTKYWHLNNQFHREDGPAIEYTDGTKSWYLYDKLHRLDGPAIEHPNGYKAWFYHGKYICKTQEEFEKLIKLKWLW